MKETLKDKFNTIKTNVKEAFDKNVNTDKSKINPDLKDKGLTGQTGVAKDDFRRTGKV